jgi:DNA-binding Xre family transcriptional regulator
MPKREKGLSLAFADTLGDDFKFPPSFKTPSGDEMVVVPKNDFVRLVEAVEDAGDVAAIRKFEHHLAASEEELIPAEFANRMIDGENPIRVWREFRGMSVKELADKAEITGPYLSQVETGKRDGTVDTLKKIADALRVKIDDLV